MDYSNITGVPDFSAIEFHEKRTRYCLCIPILNENGRIQPQLKRAMAHGVNDLCDIIICDGGSIDGSTEPKALCNLGVNTLLLKNGPGRQGAQLRMGLWWCLQRGYNGIITIDGNNKDSIEDTYRFTEKLDEGFDFIQGSRYINGGKAENTPLLRHCAVKVLHAPIISLTAGQRFTDTTNAFRGYSRHYLEHPKVQPFREIFMSYELLAHLSVMASRLGMKAVEVPVARIYPAFGPTPTKISFLNGNWNLIKILFNNWLGKYRV
ncbi:MAG: glycosyltransferase family 2 protein [Planctomycetaceae bacterium]|nr:glycosyltransferase family 2 protein [Planctomycetaceae bacterium]